MSILQRLQADFQGYIVDLDPRMEGSVVGTAKAGAAQRLGIYAEAYRQRLVEALGKNFPGLAAWLGEQAFDRLGVAYLDRHPSTHFSIRYFGHNLNRFLATDERHRDRPALAEMAAFEWALADAFDAADCPRLGVDDLGVVPPAQWPVMRFRLRHSVRRLDLRWNVPAIRQAIDRKETPPPARAQETPLAWVVWRQDRSTWFRSLAVHEAWALDAAMAGEPFAAICEGLCEWVAAEQVAAEAAGLLKRWTSDGMIMQLEWSR